MRGVSIRWWLGLAFAFIAALTAVAVAEVFSRRAEAAFRDLATDLAVGQSVAAANDLGRLLPSDRLQPELARVASARGLALFLYSPRGRLISEPHSGAVTLGSVPFRRRAVATVLDGRRFVVDVGGHDESATVMALRVFRPGGRPPFVLLVQARHEDLAVQLGILERRIAEAAVVAFVVAALAGLVIAAGIARRLGRISAFAAQIEAGDLDARHEPGFRDELGRLTETLDRMRVRLRQSFAELQRENDRRERLLERLREGVVAVDATGSVEYGNSAAARMLGVERLERGGPVPDPWESFSLPEFAGGLFNGGGADGGAVRVQAHDRVYSLVGLPRREGETAVIVVTDVSADERRERAEREFATNAAHELRTPLAAIASAVEVLQRGAKDDPGARDRFLDHIEREAARLGRLARVLLVLARAATGQERPPLGPIALDDVLDQVVAGGPPPAAGVAVEIDCPPGTLALADADLAHQIFANLYSNAVKHTQQGAIRLAARRAGEQVVVEVSDTGTGISEGVRERAFDRFYRGNHPTAEGFGLGLSIVRQSVDALGGTVAIAPRPPGGTSARVTLQAAERGA